MEREYRCKIASRAEMERKWNAMIARAGDDRANWMVWKERAIRRVLEGKSVSYYGFLGEEAICEATTHLCADAVQNAEGLVDETTAYLCAFRTEEAYRGRGYFSGLFRYMLDDLRRRGYLAVTVGVEPQETQNRALYVHYGFDQPVKSAAEIWPDGTTISVDYYRKKL